MQNTSNDELLMFCAQFAILPVMIESRPVLYSFRRCPYAMRARMGLVAAAKTVWLREVVLRDKPNEMLQVSPKGTVPVLVTAGGRVIEESLDVMYWALGKDDPQKLLPQSQSDAQASRALIEINDGAFKYHLDRYKYSTRYEGADRLDHRSAAMALMAGLEERLARTAYLLGDRKTVCDVAIFPFVRQFANTDRTWFDAQEVPGLQRWLADNLASCLFAQVMSKYPAWKTARTEFDLLSGSPRQSQSVV